MAKYIKKWVSNCQTCIQTKRINNDLLRTELPNCPEWDLGPEDILQMDILPNLPPSGGNDHIITAIDVFSKYLFAYPVTRITATAVSRVIMDILCKHTYLPTTIITDLGTQFNAQVTHEVAAVLGFEMKHATMKHAQTIGLLSPFFKLLKEFSKFYVPTNLVEDFTNLNKLLENSCQLALKQPLKNKQLIVMSDASFTAAGYAIMIEDDPNQKLQSKRKTYAPIVFGSKTFNPTQTKMSIYAKEFLSKYFAFVEFRHLMWGSTFPVIVFTDNRSVTRFFQTKMIPPALWNACDYVLQYNFVIAHVAATMNTAADFLSRTEVDPTEKLELTIRNDLHTKAIEVNIQSTGIVEEEQIYVLPDDEIDENQLWEEKQNIRNQAQTETHNEPENAVSELQQFHKPTSGLISCSSGYFKDNARIPLRYTYR